MGQAAQPCSRGLCNADCKPRAALVSDGLRDARWTGFRLDYAQRMGAELQLLGIIGTLGSERPNVSFESANAELF